MQKFVCSLSEKQESRLSRLRYAQQQVAQNAPSSPEQLKLLLSMLPEDRRELIRRYWLDGDPLEVIAEDLGISVNAVYLRLRRIRLRLTQISDCFFRTSV